MADARKNGFVRINTPQLVLRPFESIDLADLAVAFADDDIALWNPGPSGLEGAAEFMAARNDWSDGSHASWAVADRSNMLIGSVSLHKIDLDKADAEVGYWIAPWGRGRGHATQSVVAASRFAFDTLCLHRVYLYHAIENIVPAQLHALPGFPTRARSGNRSATPTASSTTSTCTPVWAPTTLEEGSELPPNRH